MTELEFLADALAAHGEELSLAIDRVGHGMLRDRLWAGVAAGAGAAGQDPPVAGRELPEHRSAIAIGYHRILICPLGSDPNRTAVEGRLRQALNQAAIDWSWLGSAGDDLLLVMVGPRGSAAEKAWLIAREAVERNERVCRTLVWLPPSDPATWNESAGPLISRTFLARPWDSAAEKGGTAPLDAWAGLAAELAADTEGFSEAAARQWIDILSDVDDPNDLAERLFAVLEPQP